jgi:uncharacterized protein (UPF0335 family)
MTQLRSFVERIERLEEEISTLNADKSEVYKEAKSTGFDVKVLRKVIAARRMDRSERQEADALFDLYMAELEGSQGLVRAHVETLNNLPETESEILGGVAGACSGIKCGENRTGTESETSGDSVERHAQISKFVADPSHATDTAGAVVAPPATVPASIHDDIPQFLKVASC